MRCDVCGDEITFESEDKRLGEIRCGMHISLDTADKHPECAKVEMMFGKLEFFVCYCCFLRGFGIEPADDEVAKMALEREKINVR